MGKLSNNTGQVAAAVANVPVLRMEVVKRSDDMNGFVALSPGSGEIAASPRTSRTLPAPWRPSLPSPPSSSPLGGLPGRRLLSQAPQKAVSHMAPLRRWVLRPGRTQRPQRQLTRGRCRKLVEMVYSGSIASGDLGLLLFSTVLQNFLNDLPAPGEGGFDMGII